MVPSDALINALRSLKFRYKTQTDRVAIYKQRGTTLRVSVRRNQIHDDFYAQTILRQAGMSGEEIDAFLSETSRSK